MLSLLIQKLIGKIDYVTIWPLAFSNEQILKQFKVDIPTALMTPNEAKK